MRLMPKSQFYSCDHYMYFRSTLVYWCRGLHLWGPVDNHTPEQDDHSRARPISSWRITYICRHAHSFGVAGHDVHAHVFGGIQILSSFVSQSQRFVWTSCVHTCISGCDACQLRSWFQGHPVYWPYFLLCFSQLLFVLFCYIVPLCLWWFSPLWRLEDLFIFVWHAFHCMRTRYSPFGEAWGLEATCLWWLTETPDTHCQICRFVILYTESN